MPQTRFVLKKSLELGLRPMVIINKIDKPAADPDRCEEQVLELFLELGATNEQADFPVIYAIGREGVAMRKLADERQDLTPLLDAILEHVPSAASAALAEKPLRAQPFNLGYDNYVGRLAVARIYEGELRVGASVFVKNADGVARPAKIVKLFGFNGLQRVETEKVSAGDIALIAGILDVTIGETIGASADVEPLPLIHIDEPTIALTFLVNNSPFAGREGKFVTTRQIRERLEKELEVNVGLKVDFSNSDTFKVSGRGELHVAILLENMRREGYELQVSQPQVIFHEVNGAQHEPFEEVVIDVPSEYQGAVIERLGLRKCIMTNMQVDGPNVRLTFEGPTRGLLGYRSQFILDTKGEGIFASRFIEFRPHAGEIQKRAVGSMISMEAGKSSGFALWNLQDRGLLYIGPAVDVYVGMVLGNTAKGDEMFVNPTKGKNLTNVRASGSDDAIVLTPPFELSIERGLEIMAEDEYLEITPENVRLRKQPGVKMK